MTGRKVRVKGVKSKVSSRKWKYSKSEGEERRERKKL